MNRTTNLQDLGDELDLHPNTLRRWCNLNQNAMPHDRGERGRMLFDVAEVRAWMERTGNDGRIGRRPGYTESGTMEKARIRKESALADKYELQVSEARKVLVDRETINREWVSRVMALKNKLLGLPAIVAPACVGLDAAEIQALLDGRITDIIRDAAEC